MNKITDVRTPKGQNNYQDWELKVLLAVDGQGVSAERVGVFLGRDVGSVRKAATKQGVSLTTKGKR